MGKISRLKFAKYLRLRKAGVEKHAAVRQAKGGRYSVFQRDLKTYLKGRKDIISKPPVVVKRIPKVVKKVWKAKRKIRIPYKKRFHPLKPAKVPLKHYALDRRCSDVDIDKWVTREGWDEVWKELESTLTNRITGVLQRQQKKGYIKFGLKLHADEQRTKGDESISIDKYVATPMARFGGKEDKTCKEMLYIAWISLHQALRDILSMYELHLDKLYVCGDKIYNE